MTMKTADVFSRITQLTCNYKPPLDKLFQVDPATIKTWKHRGTIPADAIFQLAQRHGWSLDFLVFGNAIQQPAAEQISAELDGVHVHIHLHKIAP